MKIFNINEHGVITNPNEYPICNLSNFKGLVIRTAKNESNKWYGAYSIRTSLWGCSMPIIFLSKESFFDTEEDCKHYFIEQARLHILRNNEMKKDDKLILEAIANHTKAKQLSLF